MDHKLVIVLALVGLVTVGMAETQHNASALGQNIYCNRDYVMGKMTKECEPGSTPVCHEPKTTSSLICSCSNGKAQIHSYCGYINRATPKYETAMSDIGLDLTTPSALRLYGFSIDTYYAPDSPCDTHHTLVVSPYSFTGPYVSVDKSSYNDGWEPWIPSIPSTSDWQLPIKVQAMGRNVLCSAALTVVATLEFIPHYTCNDIQVKSRMPCSYSANCGAIPYGDPTSVQCSCEEGGTQVYSYCGSNKWENPKFNHLISGIGSDLPLDPSSYSVHLAVFYARKSTGLSDPLCEKASFQLSTPSYESSVIEDPFNGEWYEKDLYVPPYYVSGYYFPLSLDVVRMSSNCRTKPSTSPTAIITLRAPASAPIPIFTPSPLARPNPRPSAPSFAELLGRFFVPFCIVTPFVIVITIAIIVFCCLRCREKRKANQHYESINTHSDDQNDADALHTLLPSSDSELP